MALLYFILCGFVIGLVTRTLLPRDRRLSLLTTTLLGAGGSFVGGYVCSIVRQDPITQVYTLGVLGSVFGALGLLWAGGGLSLRPLRHARLRHS